ncbi:gliding motility-associated C-terminal domain-containing protein [Aquimarina aquimarini]|uniref:gliding motility-associated C-terminal domain-containing protein n=1 Tax=Aquimarina aquimarini TaxID=1191734 RepID=UPI000D559020|nr:gliding motility-associated C-terminal domain-containing protein [Aquimarina aquimarini]
MNKNYLIIFLIAFYYNINAQVTLLDGLSTPSSMKIIDNRLYFSEWYQGRISYLDLDNIGVGSTVIDELASRTYGMDVYNNELYYGDSDTNPRHIRKLDLTDLNTPSIPVLFNYTFPYSLTFVGDILYVVDSIGKIVKLDMTATPIVGEDFVTNLDYPFGIIYNEIDNSLYFTQRAGSGGTPRVSKIDLSNSTPVVEDVVTNVNSPSGIGLDVKNQVLYVADPPTGAPDVVDRLVKIDLKSSSPTAEVFLDNFNAWDYLSGIHVSVTNSVTKLYFTKFFAGSIHFVDITDTDGDGVLDKVDLDDDNDGILDTIETGGLDPNEDNDNDGFSIYLDDDDSDPAIGDNDNSPQPIFDDLDGDGVPNHLDLDSDNDGILDIVEAGGADANEDGEVDYLTQGLSHTMIDVDNDGLIDALDTVDSGSGSGEVTNGTALILPNTDNEGLSNYLDIDSDNDGIPDNVEGQTTAGYQPPLEADDDNDGIDNQYDSDFGGSTPITTPTDTDANTTENLPDYLDLDSDDDGLSDTAESGLTDDGTTVDIDGDGLLDTFDTVDTIATLFDVNDTLNAGALDTIDSTADTPEVDFREIDMDKDDDGEDATTDPDDNDPCIGGDISRIDLSITTSLWAVADCDGDGVSNLKELDSDRDGTIGLDNTDPNDPCDYNSPDISLPITTTSECNIIIYNIMTPDGDNQNDTFYITGINNPKYKNNTVEIFNRWGNSVYKASGYNNENVVFRGLSTGRTTINGSEILPSGTYYYAIDFGDGSKPKVGWLYIIK